MQDGLYSLSFGDRQDREARDGFALAVLKDGKVLGSDVWGGLFEGEYRLCAAHGVGLVELSVDVPQHGELVTGFCAGPQGTRLRALATFELSEGCPSSRVEIGGDVVQLRLDYLGPIDV